MPNANEEEQFQEEGDPQPIIVQAKFTVQVSRALGSWKKHQTGVSVVQSLSQQQQQQLQHRTSAGNSEAPSPTNLQDLERMMPETPNETRLVFPQYLTQIPPVQVTRAY
jgi:hypothetical protein